MSVTFHWTSPAPCSQKQRLFYKPSTPSGACFTLVGASAYFSSQEMGEGRREKREGRRNWVSSWFEKRLRLLFVNTHPPLTKANVLLVLSLTFSPFPASMVISFHLILLVYQHSEGVCESRGSRHQAVSPSEWHWVSPTVFLATHVPQRIVRVQ